MWGYHLTVDCAGCNDNIKDKAAVGRFAADMVSALRMRAYGPPQTVRFGEDPAVTGITLVQLIETSNITGHFCDQTGEAYIDIFSCRKFAVEDAIGVIEWHFSPRAFEHTYQERQAPAVLQAVAEA